MNVNVHFAGGFYNLGLIRVRGTMATETMVKVVDKRLEEFDIEFSREICSAIIDGASIMSSFARKMNLAHATCMAHSVQRGIEDVLYPRSPSQTVKKGTMDKSDTDDEEYDQDGNANHELDFELEAYSNSVNCIRW